VLGLVCFLRGAYPGVHQGWSLGSDDRSLSDPLSPTAQLWKSASRRRIQGEVVTDVEWRTVHESFDGDALSTVCGRSVLDVEINVGDEHEGRGVPDDKKSSGDGEEKMTLGGEHRRWQSLTLASGCSPTSAACLSVGCFSGRLIHLLSKHGVEVAFADIQLHKTSVLDDRSWIRWVLKPEKVAFFFLLYLTCFSRRLLVCVFFSPQRALARFICRTSPVFPLQTCVGDDAERKTSWNVLL
jgi:hypothetical protein